MHVQQDSTISTKWEKVFWNFITCMKFRSLNIFFQPCIQRRMVGDGTVTNRIEDTEVCNAINFQLPSTFGHCHLIRCLVSQDSGRTTWHPFSGRAGAVYLVDVPKKGLGGIGAHSAWFGWLDWKSFCVTWFAIWISGSRIDRGVGRWCDPFAWL